MIPPPWGSALVVALALAGWAATLGLVSRGRSGLGVALAVAAALALVQLGWHVDDAGIVYAYARAFADGQGLVPAFGLAPVEGFSDPLWVAVLVPFAAMGLDPAMAAKGLSIGLALATVWGAHRLALRTGASLLEADVLAIALATSGVAGIWWASGLEVALYSWLLVLVAALACGGEPESDPSLGGSGGSRGRWWSTLELIALVVAVAAAAWTRPEGGVAAAGVAAVVGLARRRPWPALAGLIGLLIGSAALVAVRWLWLQELVPNTAWAKLPSPGWWTLARGVAYVAWSSLIAGWIPLGLAAAPAFAGTSRRGLVAGGAVAVGAAAFAVLMGGDWMSHARFFAPYQAVVLALVVPPLVRVIRLEARGYRAALVLAVLAGGIGVAVFGHGAARPTLALDLGVRKGELFAELVAPCGDPSVATPDVGGVVYGWPELQVVDLAGLLDAEAARHRRHPGYWPARIGVQRPSLVDLHDGWARRTGLTDRVLIDLGYRQWCRRWEDPDAPTLWAEPRCAETLSPWGEELLDRFCAEGLPGLRSLR